MERLQDGYAVRSSYPAGDYEVEFEALAGEPQSEMSEGTIVYITTGSDHVACAALTHCFVTTPYTAYLI